MTLISLNNFYYIKKELFEEIPTIFSIEGFYLIKFGI